MEPTRIARSRSGSLHRSWFCDAWVHFAGGPNNSSVSPSRTPAGLNRTNAAVIVRTWDRLVAGRARSSSCSLASQARTKYSAAINGQLSTWDHSSGCVGGPLTVS